MAQGNVIVRSMAKIEAIGGVTNICSDKTGTLTQGKMVVHSMYCAPFFLCVIKVAGNLNTVQILAFKIGLLAPFLVGKFLRVQF